MLHRARYHDCEGPFGAILQFQRQFLLFACGEHTPAAPSIDDLKNFFGEDLADWLRKLLWWQRGANQGSPKPLYNALVQLIQYMQASPKNTREEILAAFDNDTGFQEHQDAYSDEIVHEFRACRPPVGAKRRQREHYTLKWSA
jgi:hypothetical protein